MPLFGSHLSIAGGYYKAVEAAAALGMDTVQLFTKNNNQWAAKPLDPAVVTVGAIHGGTAHNIIPTTTPPIALHISQRFCSSPRRADTT